MTDTRIGFIITFFKTSEEGYNILRKNVEILSKENYYLILASHSPVDIEIQEMCDYYFYQKKNVVDDRKYSHGVAESNLIEISLKHLRDTGINWTCKTSYDIEIANVDRFLDWRKDFKYDFVSCNRGDNIICTNSFFSKVDFLLDNITFYKSIEEMFKINNALDNCWEIEIRQKDLVKNTFAFKDKQEFYGENKIDLFDYNYDEIYFSYAVEENKFYVINNGIEIDEKVEIRLFDYYTDSCIYLNREWYLNKGICFWFIPPFALNMPRSKNGYYLEIYLGDRIIRKNIGISDFDYKHPLSKKFEVIKSEEVKFNEFCDFDEFNIYSQFNIDLDSIRNYLDIGANYSMSSIPFLIRNTKIYLLDADSYNISILKRMFGSNTGRIKIIDKAISKNGGMIDFYERKGVGSVVSSMYERDANFLTLDNEKKEIDSITSNDLIEKYIDECEIDLLKIDIEGTEYDFFETISDDNIKRIKRFIIEFHFNTNFEVMKILERLTGNNFQFKLQKFSVQDDDYILGNIMGVIYAYK